MSNPFYCFKTSCFKAVHTNSKDSSEMFNSGCFCFHSGHLFEVVVQWHFIMGAFHDFTTIFWRSVSTNVGGFALLLSFLCETKQVNGRSSLYILVCLRFTFMLTRQKSEWLKWQFTALHALLAHPIFCITLMHLSLPSWVDGRWELAACLLSSLGTRPLKIKKESLVNQLGWKCTLYPWPGSLRLAFD